VRTADGERNRGAAIFNKKPCVDASAAGPATVDTSGADSVSTAAGSEVANFAGADSVSTASEQDPVEQRASLAKEEGMTRRLEGSWIDEIDDSFCHSSTWYGWHCPACGTDVLYPSRRPRPRGGRSHDARRRSRERRLAREVDNL